MHFTDLSTGAVKAQWSTGNGGTLLLEKLGLGRPADALAAYERHLASERDLTPHTVRAYLGDVAGLLEHASALGHHDVSTLDLRTLRSWLARQQTLGKARSTMARRSAAVRVCILPQCGRPSTDLAIASNWAK